MKQALLILFLLGGLRNFSFGQYILSISGKIKGSKNEPLPSAYLMLLRDTSLQRTCVTDADGQFVMKPVSAADYTIRISNVGYGNYTTVLLHVTGNVTLPDITMQQRWQKKRRTGPPAATHKDSSSFKQKTDHSGLLLRPVFSPAFTMGHICFSVSVP